MVTCRRMLPVIFPTNCVEFVPAQGFVRVRGRTNLEHHDPQGCHNCNLWQIPKPAHIDDLLRDVDLKISKQLGLVVGVVFGSVDLADLPKAQHLAFFVGPQSEQDLLLLR